MISYTYKALENQLDKMQFHDFTIALISTIQLAADYLPHSHIADFLCGILVTKNSKASVWILNRSDELLWSELTRTAARLGASCFIFLGRILPINQKNLMTGYIIRDHINVSGKNPLIGPNDSHFGTRFPDMSNLYDNELRKLAMKRMEQLGKPLNVAVCLVPQSNLQITALEDKILSIRDDLVVSHDVYAGAITARHLSGRSVGLLFDDSVPIDMLNLLVSEIVDQISQV